MIEETTVLSAEELEDFDDEYVYDIGIDSEDNHYFFANDILLHNSCYFSAYESFKQNNIDFEFTPENTIELYDGIVDIVNDSFAGFMDEYFNTGLEQGAIIKSVREVVATSGLFVAKKYYGLLMIDKDGKRVDINGKPGKLKVTGLSIVRSDTPKNIQKFLYDLLMMVLTNKSKDECSNFVREFYTEFDKLDPWLKGTPKTIKDLTKNVLALANTSAGFKARISGHAKASINWNKMVVANNDKQSPLITNGTRIIVCKLKNYEIDSIAFPIDIKDIPDWFRVLPFDEDDMVESILRKKLDTIFGCLDWRLGKCANVVSKAMKLFNY
jgi:hypothetical protein